jgi:AcrR family transcriptional regulator
MGAMVRWEPGATDRLREAALELYVEQGYDETTVAEIAERAGVTARTFFRHFADKREVLFRGSEFLSEGMVAAVHQAPAEASPLDAVTRALDAAAAKLGVDHSYAKRRMSVIHANPELMERELIKMAGLGNALTAALVERGTDPTEARLAAEAGIAVFRTGFDRWVAGPRRGDLVTLLADSMDRLRALSTPAR